MRLVVFAFLIALSGCGSCLDESAPRSTTTEPEVADQPEGPDEAEAPDEAEVPDEVIAPETARPETIGELLRALHGAGPHAVFRRYPGTDAAGGSCEGFSGCRLCNDGSTGGACDDETYRVVCEAEPVYPRSGQHAGTPVRWSADGRRAWVELPGIPNPVQPPPGFRETFYFDEDGVVLGLARSDIGEDPSLDVSELAAQSARKCRYREAIMAPELAEWDRIGFFSHVYADLGEEQDRNYELHLCGSGVPGLVRTLIEEINGYGGFDGCEITDDAVQCWVFGTEARMVYHAIDRGGADSPSLEVTAIYSEAALLDEEPAEEQADDIAAFLERVRSRQPRRVGRPLLAPDPLPAGVSPCR